MKEYNIPRGTIARIMGIERPKESKAATEEEGHLAEEERMFDDVGVYVQDPNINIKWIYDGTSTPTSEWDTCAAHAVVKYAGGKVLQYNTNNEVIYNKENLLNPYFIVI